MGQRTEELHTTSIPQFRAAPRRAHSPALPACYEGKWSTAFDVPEKNPRAQRGRHRQRPREWEVLGGVDQSCQRLDTELHERARGHELQRASTDNYFCRVLLNEEQRNGARDECGVRRGPCKDVKYHSVLESW